MADKTHLAEHFIDALPEAAARILEMQTPSELSEFIDKIPDLLSSKALANMLPYHAAQSLSGLSDDASTRYLKALPIQTVVSILRYAAPDHRRRLLGALPRAMNVQVALLLHYSRRTVGAWMDPSAQTLPMNHNVAEAISHLKKNEIPQQTDVFLVDDRGRLEGMVTLAAIFLAKSDMLISDFANPVLHRLSASTTLATSSQHIGWKKADWIPVVDHIGRFVGVLRYAALRAGLATETETAMDVAPTTGHALELSTLWFHALAGMLNVALTRIENHSAPSTSD